MFLNNARTRSSGEREGLIFFYRSVKREGREKLFIVLLAEKTKTNSDCPRAFFRLPFSFLSFFVFLSVRTDSRRRRLFFGPSKRSSSVRETERRRRENTFHRGRREERSEEEEARRRRRRRRRRNFYDFYDFYDENAFLSVLFFF